MARKNILQLLEDRENTPQGDTPLPISLPDTYEDKSLMPVLAPKGRELEEYRVRFAAQEAGIDPDIAAGIAMQESGFNPSAKSPTGVRGTMQVTKPTALEMGYDRDIPDQNIRAGVAYLKKGSDRYPNDPAKSISHYPNPADIPQYIPSVMGHMDTAKANRANARQTIDQAMAEIPDDYFNIPLQESNPMPSNGSSQPVLEDNSANPTPSVLDEKEPSTIDQILGYLKSPTLDDNGQPITMTGPMGIPTNVPPPGELAGQAATVASMGLGGPIIGGATKLASKIPAVSKAISGGTKMGTVIKTAIQSLYGAGTGAAISTVKGHPEEADTSALIGGGVPIAINTLSASMSSLANKLGDMNLGKSGIAKWVNKTFGATKSLNSLSQKNQIAYSKTEQKLQQTLSQADDSMGTIRIDKNQLANRVSKGADGVTKETNILHRAAEDVIANEGPEEAANVLRQLGDRVSKGDAFTRIELNAMKRAIYDYGSAWTKAGAIKSGQFSKNSAKIARYVRKTIEDSVTSGEAVNSISSLNKEESMHMLLRNTIAKKLNTKPSGWSYLFKLAPAAALGSVNPYLGAAALGSQTVPGFTSMAAVGKALADPSISKILSILAPQYKINRPKGE